MDLDARTLASVAAYDGNARRYQESLRLRRPVADVRRFADLVAPDGLVLDAGCGPANDLRLLRDAGVHPVGVDLSFGALAEARMLLPRHPLVQAPYDRLPFLPRSFDGLWLSGSFDHLPRAAWRASLGALLEYLDTGPVYLSCVRGGEDLAPVKDPVLGAVHVSSVSEAEVAALLTSHGVTDLSIEVRPDPILDRRRPLIVALGRFARAGA